MATEAAAPRRRRSVTVVVVIAAIVAFLSIFASWVKQQALDTDEWTDTSAQLLEDEQIREAVAIYLVDQLYANVDVAAEIRGLLPSEAQRLAGPVAAGLREFAQRAALRALANARVQEAWKNANREAHKELLDVIKDRGEFVSTGGGEVTLNLRPLVATVGDRVGIGGKLTGKLPPDAGELRIMRSDQLEAAQTIVNLIEDLAIVLPLLWLALWALAMYLAVGRRRETLRGIGLGLIVAGIAVLLLRALAGDEVVNALASTSVDQAADDTWSIATSLLTEIAQSVIAIGILILIGAWLAGDTRPAVGFRRVAAPYMRERPGLTYGVVVAIFLFLVIWAPVRAFTRPVPVILIGALMLLGTEALRRWTAREFPDAPLPEGGISGSFARWRAERASRSSSPTAQAGQRSVEQLERLSSLREKGVLSQEEFEAQKAAIIGP